MPGRRAFPYSVEAEDQAAPLPRRKARYRDRPRSFNTCSAAGTFAAKRAATTGRRQYVKFNPAFGVWQVRERGLGVLDLTVSLNRMEREA